MPRIAPSIAGVLSGPTATAEWVQHPSVSKRRRVRKKDLELLSKVPLFAGLSTRHLKRIAELTGESRFKPGVYIVQEGTPGHAFHAIVEGEAKVTRRGRTIARLGAGEFFGEIALLDGAPRTASVVAITPLVTIRLNRSAFLKVLKSEPAISFVVLNEVTRRLRSRDRLLND